MYENNQYQSEGGNDQMNKAQDNERVPFSLFHAAVEREKEQDEKQPVVKSDAKEGDE